MNNALQKIYAAARANFCVTSFVRTVAVCVFGCAAASSAMADSEQARRDETQRSQAAQRQAQQQAQQQREQRQYEQRALEARAEELRRLQQQEQHAQHADAFRRNGRLTPDERRDLRRQINEVGADIYSATPRR